MKKITNDLVRFITWPVSKFLQHGMIGGVLLLTATLIAFFWANSPLAESYHDLLHTPVSLSIASFKLDSTLAHWINDGLMAIFFFVVGLEIKRELLVGELCDRKKALLPAIAALGGMIVPAILYTLFNFGGPTSSGWGIPMATDIAFAVGVMVVLGKRIPAPLKIFLLALAIFDDMGAIIVIAVFYTGSVNVMNLIIAAIILMVSTFLNYIGVRRTSPYALLGVALWLVLLNSGIHATIAGVLLAMTIPSRSKTGSTEFLCNAGKMIEEFPDKEVHIMVVDEKQREVMKNMQVCIEDLNTPLQRLEDGLYGMANYVIVPLFALANAGVSVFHGTTEITLLHPISIGVILGLVLGKPVGIFVFTLVSAKIGLTRLPKNVTKLQIWSIGCLGGIGFTMSLFVTNLAFQDAAYIDQAKFSILIASLISAILGSTLFLLLGKNAEKKSE